MQIKTNPNAKYKPSTANIAWQYTSSGRFPSTVSAGNSGNFDLNVLYKDIKLPEKKEQSVKKPVQAKKSNTQIAKEVKAGKWGNGATRKKKLKAAGYDYNAIQKIVNKLSKK